MREVVLDTETTGLDPAKGDRIVEIGCIELMHLVPTGRQFHEYINPERPMSAEAESVHGLDDKFLADKPVFAAVAGPFLDFIGDAPLIIHNAGFDLAFLNAELARLDLPPIAKGRAVDTLAMARQRYPGAQANLDALCARFGIDCTRRTLHGALLDSFLLAEVYLELRGGRQPGLVLDTALATAAARAAVSRPYREPRPHQPSVEELAAHEAFLETLKNPIWRQVE
ncbi:MAG: DNA polymerase III subunit epsilon [Rhodospirillaceae bacterium]|nr:DNA polymerase III subunit epsilon [Rhodospirillaceae bacterium]